MAIVATIQVGANPDGIGYDGTNGDIYVSNVGSANVTVVNGFSKVSTISVGTEPEGVAYNPTNGYVYVAEGNDNDLTVISGKTGKIVTTIPLGAFTFPDRIAFDDGNNNLYVTDQQMDEVSVVHGTSVVTTIPVGTFPYGVTYDSANGDVYVSNSGTSSNDISVISGTSNAVIATIPIGQGPTDLAYDSHNGYIYVANANCVGSPLCGIDNVSVINGSTNKVVSSVPVGVLAWGVAVDQASGLAYVANEGSNNVSVINGTRVVGSITVGTGPMALSYDSGNGDIYVANEYSNDVSVINPNMPSIATPVPSPSSVDIGQSTVFRTSASGGSPPYTYHWAESSVSLGCTLGSVSYTNCTPIAAGTGYTVTVNVTTSQGYTSANAVSSSFAVYGDPKVSTPTASNVSIDAGQNVTFSSTTNGGSGGNAYSWSGLPSGCKSVSTLSLTCVPVQSGAFLIRVSVTDSNGFTNTSGSLSFSVRPALTVNASASSENGTAPLTVDFTSSPTGGTGSYTRFTWTFGDGNSSSMRNASHTYASAGNYAAKVIVVDSASSSATSAPITINVHALPVLDAVVTNPMTATVNVSGTRVFTATPSCLPSPCPSGVSYAWSVNDSLGHVTPSTGPSTTFAAGNNPGLTQLTVTATWNGVTKWANATITVMISSGPSLTSVAISPPSDTLYIASNTSFAAMPYCSGGSCPSGITYAWSLNNKLAVLSSTTDLSVRLTAGKTAGTVTLYLNATLNGATKEATATITISSTPVPTLASVSINPSSPSVTVGTTQTFLAAPMCNGGTCPAGTAYAWKLSNSLGNLSLATGSSTVFTAGSKTGTVTLTVEATLNGKTAWSNTTITTQTKSSGSTGFLGLPGYEGYILIGVVVAVVAAGVAFMLMRKRTPPKPTSTSPRESEEGKASEKTEGKEEPSSEPEKKE